MASSAAIVNIVNDATSGDTEAIHNANSRKAVAVAHSAGPGDIPALFFPNLVAQNALEERQ